MDRDCISEYGPKLVLREFARLEAETSGTVNFGAGVAPSTRTFPRTSLCGTTVNSKLVTFLSVTVISLGGAEGKPAAVRRALKDTLQAILDRAVADSAFSGAVAVIGSHTGPMVTVTAGLQDWKSQYKTTINTIWDLASLTKVVATTSAMMQLVESGKIDLDAPVQRYLPDWIGTNKEKVTVRHLLTHQSGLPAFKTYYKENVSADSTLRLFFNTPLDTLPGVRMVYSDIGVILLGKIIERGLGGYRPPATHVS